MKTESHDIEPGDVIIIHGLDLPEDEQFEEIAATIHELHPKSLIIAFSGDETFETASLDEIEAMLEDLRAHKRALEESR